ncbi:DMT family transporter [Micromonospora polyrhachis]|uniref:Drug/metabolite transporter (DMT)-like permease n=1 Tax=Micromonospora polyrhachis TaxID=1282883 RepID=A0A7W7SNK3_9ACTN|nr:DMT family transporter [Micromonospora polyrhachis]MBB4958079.1 drug/metabolite transporter (DMT)-like permease [Micromonospora polyrhachis]
MNPKDLRALLLCVAGMAIVGSSVSISQLILDYPPLTGQALRYALATAVLLAIARCFPRLGGGEVGTGGRLTGREWGILLALAATGMAAFNACILIALPHADPAVVGTFIGAAPLGLALLGPLLRGGRPTVRLVAAAGIVVAGTALVHGSGRSDVIGLLASLGAFGGEVAFSLLAAMVLPRLGAVRVAAYSCALAVPLLLVTAVATGEPARWRLPTQVEAITLGYLAALMTVVAFLAWFTGLRRLGVERAGILVGLMPLATLITAAIQAGQLPDLGQSLGVLVVAAGLAVGLTARHRSPVDQPDLLAEGADSKVTIDPLESNRVRPQAVAGEAAGYSLGNKSGSAAATG